MPINAGPSQGFFGRMSGQMPGMINALAQNYGDPRLQGAARMTGTMNRNRPLKSRPTTPSPTGLKAPVQPNRPAGGMGVNPNPKFGSNSGRIVMPPPQFDTRMFGGFGDTNSPMPMPGNTGVSGMGFPGGMSTGQMGNGSGFWDTYNRLSGQPSGQLFY